jgi:uncharacterized membrane protein
MNDVILARALHVLGVVIWIGGVAVITTIVLPAARRGAFGPDPLRAFETIEQRFAWQARVAVIIVGLSGLYMTYRLDFWDRFRSASFWWMHAMVVVWLLFASILFVAEPLIARQRLDRLAAARPEEALAWLHRGHCLLLALATIAILGAVAGSQGWTPF